MYCREGRERFEATDEVRLLGAHIKGQLDCTGGKFSSHSEKRPALSADFLTVDGGMFCRESGDGHERFEAIGEVRLLVAHIKGPLDCTGGKFSSHSKDRPALSADGLTVDGAMFCRKGRERFEATGEVRLLVANIKGPLDCT
jgi:predicted  nucleic acid-binding Zn-ribbon protein